MSRRSDWKERLRAYIRASHKSEFAFGTNDCALFAAGAIEAMTGTDLAAEFRGKYTTKEAGYELLAKAGFTSPVELLVAHLPEAPFAQPGDIVVLEDEVTGVAQGRGVYALTPNGIGFVRSVPIQRVFRV